MLYLGQSRAGFQTTASSPSAYGTPTKMPPKFSNRQVAKMLSLQSISPKPMKSFRQPSMTFLLILGKLHPHEIRTGINSETLARHTAMATSHFIAFSLRMLLMMIQSYRAVQVPMTSTRYSAKPLEVSHEYQPHFLKRVSTYFNTKIYRFMHLSDTNGLMSRKSRWMYQALCI